MKNLLSGSAVALALTAAVPAFAQDQETPVSADQLATPHPATPQAEEPDYINVEGSRSDGHGPAGMMGDHTHDKGGFMVGLSLSHEDYRGTNLRGTTKISDEALAAAGFGARTKSMTMDMAMLHLMWAPSGRVTFMAMPMWMRMDMVMVGTGMEDHGGGHGGHGGGHSMAKGATMKHGTEGFGDTAVSALVTLSKGPHHQLHATAGVSIPTGSVSRKNPDGSFVHYGMQSGSGTWDLTPQLTWRGWQGKWGWGVQTGYIFRAEDANKSGFRFGDRFTATGWTSYALSNRVSLSGRIAFLTEGKVEGHYNAKHNHSTPSDLQANYGGDRVDAALGVNTMLAGRFRVNAEASLPVYQRMNGIQAPKRFGVNLGVSTMF